MSHTSLENKPQSRPHLFSLARQIQLSGLIALLLFIALIFLGVFFFRQIQTQTLSFELGTIFSDRSVSQLQRELLKLNVVVANPELVDEESFLLQRSLVHSRFNILDESIAKIHPSQTIQDQSADLTTMWETLLPQLEDWQRIETDPDFQQDVLTQMKEMELVVNSMVQQYEFLRLDRGQLTQVASERLGALFAIVTLFFIIFVFTVIYNTYRFVQEQAFAEEQLAIYTAELERSNRELQQFAYAASHDLQEPLRKIRTFGQRLQMRNEDILDQRSLDYIDRMNNAAVRMQALIDDLLSFSRVTTQAAPFVQTDLNQVVKDVLNDLETRIEEVNGQVTAELLPTIEADSVQMRQLLQNLISNALKFHQEDIPPIVKIDGTVVGKNGRELLHLSVADNGIGMDAEYYDRIFELFQRLHGRSQYEGTGIGLAICRRIADRHHGTIRVQSQLNEGTTFIITLPITQNG